MSEGDLLAVWLTLRLAASTTAILLLLSPPLAWWLSRSQHRLRPVVEALVALPLVLPPTVLGFYLLLAFSPPTAWVPGGAIPSGRRSRSVLPACCWPPFSTRFLLWCSRSPPPSSTWATRAGGRRHPGVWAGGALLPHHLADDVAQLRDGGGARFCPLGEFGVVLMIGGNIPGETRCSPSPCLITWRRWTIKMPTCWRAA